jgi:hypothetical protein
MPANTILRYNERTQNESERAYNHDAWKSSISRHHGYII